MQFIYITGEETAPTKRAPLTFDLILSMQHT